MGINSDLASYLLSVIGISNTVSRVVLGYISDKSWVNRLYVYNAALTLCGIGKYIPNIRSIFKLIKNGILHTLEIPGGYNFSYSQEPALVFGLVISGVK